MPVRKLISGFCARFGLPELYDCLQDICKTLYEYTFRLRIFRKKNLGKDEKKKKEGRGTGGIGSGLLQWEWAGSR